MKLERVYGFDEVAILPGRETCDPDDTDTSVKIGDLKIDVPILISAMDGVVDVNMAKAMSKLGGVAVLNLEGIYTRYDDTSKVLEDIIGASDSEFTPIMQKIYQEPIKEELIAKRIKEMKEDGGVAVVSATPQKADWLGKIAADAGADAIVVQATVITIKYKSKSYKPFDLKKFVESVNIPVIAGNCVTYDVAKDLMETGVAAILVGVGPGAACTTRGVLGIGLPQVTATMNAARARDDYYKETGKYVNIITDGGMTTGGDICKAIASGADMVMLGNAFARANESPGKGYHWGMALPHPYLPRGTRIHVGISGSLEEITIGPAKTEDGTQNLVGAIKLSMSYCGAQTIPEFHKKVQLVIAPGIKTEGKIYQKAQRVGMGK